MRWKLFTLTLAVFLCAGAVVSQAVSSDEEQLDLVDLVDIAIESVQIYETTHGTYSITAVIKYFQGDQYMDVTAPVHLYRNGSPEAVEEIFLPSMSDGTVFDPGDSTRTAVALGKKRCAKLKNPEDPNKPCGNISCKSPKKCKLGVDDKCHCVSEESVAVEFEIERGTERGDAMGRDTIMLLVDLDNQFRNEFEHNNVWVGTLPGN